MNTSYIALGSNLDNPLQHVKTAVSDIAKLGTVAACSSWYRSDPVGPQDQPDFINGVLALETHLAPLPLLDALQHIEQSHQRVRDQHWGPRTLDLDILLYNDQVVALERLSIPHPWMTERGFVLFPLLEIAPTLVMPNGEAVVTLASQLDPTALEKLA